MGSYIDNRSLISFNGSVIEILVVVYNVVVTMEIDDEINGDYWRRAV